MPRCAFLTTDELEEFFVYDDLVKPFLSELNWEVDDVSWHAENPNYDQYDMVVVRSTWDYQSSPEKFAEVLSQIEQSSAELQNPYKLMLWNFSKHYLQDFEASGVPILPTIWLDEFDNQAIQNAYSHFNTAEIIIKPWVSANADFTYRLTEQTFKSEWQNIKQALAGKPIMVQKFEKNILALGEFSLFYFADQYSHAINKRPCAGDFRVQEEHGGELVSVMPTEDMLSLAQKTIKCLPYKSLYARIDILETDEGLAIIEVELIEPSLYFNMDDGSAKRFAKALDQQYQLTHS